MKDKLFTVKVSDNADDEYWHNQAVYRKLNKYEKWFEKTNFKRDTDYIFSQQYADSCTYLSLDVYVDIKIDELKMLYKLRWK
jgi:hypothetical protein|tara:strand:+ start:64 stop:309 length:246 start_codon:yes stop_codon:yes gene_type:complete